MRSIPCARQLAVESLNVRQSDRIDWEPAHQRAPFGGHVGDAQARVHGERRHARASELDGGIQHFFVVVETAQRDDDVFAGHARGQLAFEHHLDGARNLPPEFARCPDGCRVGANHGRADCAERAIHVGVRVGRDHEVARQHIATLHHDLVADARTRRVEVDAMLRSESFHAAVFGEVRLVRVLDVVVER